MKTPSRTQSARSRARGFISLKTLFIASACAAIGAAMVPVAISLQPSSGGPVAAAPYSGTIRDYLRVERGADNEAASLQTSIVRLTGPQPDGLLVDLVSAVHVGDASYYNTLNAQLAQYDAVLYELVAPEGMNHGAALSARRDNPPDDALAMLMALGKRLFAFRGQLESVDYNRPNFVHADLSPGQMMEAVRARGDNEVSLALGIAADLIRVSNLEAQRLEAGAAARAQSGAARSEQPLDILAWLADPHAVTKFKRMLAEQFDSGDITTRIGPTLNTLLISDRNARAAEVLAREIASGKRKIAIFYGAAHMPDLERRITAAHGLKRTVCHWLTAWDLRIPGSETQPTLTVSGR